ncbi:MAG: PfkB family carbohydrate kinase [Brevinema sp.]
MTKVLVIGSAIIDIMIYLDTLPKTGQDIEAYNEKINIGGCALNVVSVLKAFDLEFTAFLPVGNGHYGNMIRQYLFSIGVDPILPINTGDNGYCYTFIEKHGERTFITLSGIEKHFQNFWFDRLDNKDYGYAYVSGYSLQGESGKNIVDFLENNTHIKMIFAPGPRINTIDAQLLSRIFNLAPIIHINENELSILSDKKDLESRLINLHQNTNELIITSLGIRGASYISNGNIEYVQGEKVPIVNTSGAGDSHIGAIIVGLVKKQPLQDIITFANNVAAKVVSQEDTKYKE